MSELPDNLLEEIFFLLPATSVIRLRSTCKRWNRLLKDRVFTKSHLDKAPKQFQSLMLTASEVCLMHIDIDRFTVKGEASPTNPYYSRIDQISHCDGLLLCYTDTNTLVLWNPCTGQTMWIQPDSYEPICNYFLGSYQDKESNGNSYKILRHRMHRNCYPRNNANKRIFGIYEINSDSYSWRIIDVTIDFEFDSFSCGVSLKGKTYWIGKKIESNTCVETFIVRFDYTAERFERLCLLPYQYDSYANLSLSVVREEKLAVLLQHRRGEETELWVTNKISETKEVSWSKLFAFDFDPPFSRWVGRTFVVDEEKKVLVYCENGAGVYGDGTKVSIVREDNTVRLDFPSRPPLLNYVPSLIRIQHDI